MRRTLLSLLFLVGMLTAAQADGYTYLTFETTDGAKTSVDCSSLTLTISGTTLTAGAQQFTLSNLSKMYFSTSDETTGIEALKADDLNDAAEIYDLQGKKIAKSQTMKGIYIIKTKQGTHKIVKQ
ncbi:MAG: T9SS type A sorting domain-containing protein [Prevotella sp.]|nr:T9SS type A sorting domain-containing protein [Prevotella sp.]